MQVYLPLAFILHLAFALVTPPFQTPDEQQHLFRAWQLSEFRSLGEKRDETAGGVLPGGLGPAATREIGSIDPHARKRLIASRPVAEVRNTHWNAGSPRYYNFFGAVLYPPSSYGLQVLAIWTGKATHMSVENVVRLGRLLNSVLAIVLIALAIRTTPWGKWGLVAFGLLPMTIASSAAFGQDGLVIGGSFLLLALGLRGALVQPWTKAQLACVALLGSAVTLAKIVYLPLILTAGLFDASNPSERRRRAASLLLISSVTITITLAWLRLVSPLQVNFDPIVPPANVRVAQLIADPWSLALALWNAYVIDGFSVVKSTFRFGWLNIGPIWTAMWPSLVMLASVFLLGNSDGKTPAIGLRLWLVILGLAISVLIGLALFISYTPPGYVGIRGLQGRYFIPVAAAMLIAVLPTRVYFRWGTEILIVSAIAANLICLTEIASVFYRA